MRRRHVLALIGAAVGSLAGCAGEPPDSEPAGTASPTPGASDPSPSTAESPTATPTAASTDTSGAATLRLSPVDPPTDATLVVYPTALQSWLREAASTGTTLRVHATAPVVMPEPPLPAFDRVRLQDPTGDTDGWYAVEGDAGIRYRYLAGATEATPPDGASVTPVSQLEAPRRRLVLAAIRGETGDAARFYPETALGEWARTEFFGGYVRHDGTVYQGMEVQQTDAAFFSRECWYVFSLTPVDGGPGPTLRLADIDSDVRRIIDDMLGERDPEETVNRTAGNAPRSVVRFVEDTDYLLTHSAVLATTIEGG